MCFVGVQDDESIIWLFRDGELVFRNPSKRSLTVSDEDIIHANNSAQLIGDLGMATLFGHCETCGWRGHTHFSIGDSDRDMAHFELEDAHDANCSETFETEEVHN